MASGSPRDITYGKPYTGTPVQQVDPRTAGTLSVLNMNALKSETTTVSTSDDHYTPNGNLYHE